MVFENHTILGIFREELKNRFLCRVTIDGKDTICYIPSSCRLSNFIEMVGKIVMLKRVQTKNARTQYSLYAVKINNHFVPVNLAGTNKIIENNIKNRRFSFLGRRNTVSREECISGYKADLFISDTKTVIEIKSILSLQKSAVFPSVFSERAINQLQEFERLLKEGYKVCYMFVSMNSGVDEIVINRHDEVFFSQMCHLINMGMQYVAVSLTMKNDTITIMRRIPLRFETEKNI